MKRIFDLSTTYRYLKVLVFATVYLFTSPTLAITAGYNCEFFFSLGNNPTVIAKTIDQQIFDKITATDSWSGKPKPVLFNNREILPSGIELKNYPQNVKEYISFAYGRLNDPYSFQDFIKEVLAIAGTPSGQIPRKGVVRDILLHMIQQGGFSLERVPFLQNHDFHDRLRNGVAMIESAEAFSKNGHGMDSHLVQLAYMIHEFNRRFGPYHFLAFYKFMGLRYEIWSIIFDHPSPDHLGNPSNIRNYVSPSLGLE